jgi:heme/copper-type cytochrome/quinol oxidase subunit 2
MGIGAAPLLAGCEGRLSTLDPLGPPAASIAMMWSVMLAGATLIFVLVMILLALGMRRQPDARGSSQSLWLGWGAMGFVPAVLFALLVYAFVIGERLRPLDGPDAVTVRATAEQWQWRFSYGTAAREDTQGILVIPAGRPVTVEVTATDVIHGFWVPRLAGKIDAIPGHVARLRLEARAPGVHAGLCAEFCGIGHRSHNFSVVAVTPADWAAFVAGSTAPILAKAGADD